MNGFVSGSGFQYTRYDITDLSTKTAAGLKAAVDSNANTIVVQETGIRAELESTNIYGVNYGQVFKGYFYAPVSGDYIFRGAADDTFQLYLSSNYGSAEIGATPLISLSSYSNYADNYYVKNESSSMSAPTTLVGGKYYYMEVYHTNSAGAGYLKISVEVPNTNIELGWQSHEVNQFETTFTNEP